MSVDADEVPAVPEVPDVPVAVPDVVPDPVPDVAPDPVPDVGTDVVPDVGTDSATAIAVDLAVVPGARTPVASLDPRPSEPLPPEALGLDTAAAVVVPAASTPDLDAAPDAAAPTPSAPAPSRPSVTGRRGRYRVDEMLGRGGASAVHRGWDRLLHRPVALKLLSYEVQPQPDDRHREARVVAGLDHPGLVPVYDVSRLDGHDAVVMQLIDGPSLAERLREGGPLPLAETLRLGAEVADGLAHVHTRDIVHRDVKPANILLAEGGARLTDFGIARAPGTTTLTGQGLILGTAAYLAPEQVRHGDASPAVDLFALGLVLVECLTGTPCYPSSPSECAARLETPAALPADVPERVRELLAALTDLDPAARPSAEETATRLGALADLLDAEGVAALDTPSPEVVRARPVPFASAVIGLLLVTAVVAGVLALVNGRPDLGVPVLVAAVAAQGAVLWNGRRAPRPDPPRRDGRPGPGGGRPAAPAGP